MSNELQHLMLRPGSKLCEACQAQVVTSDLRMVTPESVPVADQRVALRRTIAKLEAELLDLQGD